MHMHGLERNIALFRRLRCGQKLINLTNPTLNDCVNTSQEGS